MSRLPTARNLKGSALRSLNRAGCAGLLGKSRWRRQRLLILGYHGVAQDDEYLWDAALYVSTEMLDERLWILRKRGCAVLPLDDAIARLYAGTLDDRSVTLTFDDGYCDFATRALPLLQKYGVPATNYLPTLRLECNAPVFPLVCSYMFWKSGQRSVRVPEVRQESFDISNEQTRRATVATIHECVKRRRLEQSDRTALVRSIADRLAVDYDAIAAKRLFQVMSPEEVRRLAAVGVDFQLHTHTHNTPLDRELFAGEIVTNHNCIRNLTGVPPAHFCYPSGNYDMRFLPWLADLGVRSATTCDPGLASASTPRLLLPRYIDTANRSAVEFDGWVTGTAALLSRRRSYAAPALS